MTDPLPRCPITLKAMRTRQEVDEHIHQWRSTKPKRAPRLRPYQCPYCDAWHTTKNTKPTKKRTKGVSW
ncbi:hypothetical protein [Demequina globuliformis]|uniref:hypothetical protein n=1 Tax=Demequina globuliformis TaxID=676202 RepID=UPI000782A713|nr:hypothetical protein [Demequina globuliformis]